MTDIDFLRGHVGINSSDAELIDEEGKCVPLYETYIHHWFALDTLKIQKQLRVFLKDPFSLETKAHAKVVICHIIGAWEMNHKEQPQTFHIFLLVGNPEGILNGFEEKWFFNIMAIDTRGVQDRKSCSECRCDLMNITKDIFSTTKGVDGKQLS
ncbi:uncharacterized protein LOC133313505 [Gastrolobium bilobum]|uniref:uncharacterized protein LOC133313505 n=1 Tax=Gastrolobium bilobum TaxID=150636 RepID=UPI002AAF90C3|nr:uncharacterized protein LOC133313505 [Gastrolobium bilobum]